jgi:hypothetical protein
MFRAIEGEPMKTQNALSLILIGLVSVWTPAAVDHARAQEKPAVQVQIPKPGVPQIMTMEGKFVRAAYNNEGYVIIGYQLVNRSIGEDWMLLDSPAVDQRAPGRRHACAREPGEGPARLDQLLSAECEPRVRAHLLPRSDLSRVAGR